jgi:hypothetical protein
MSLPRALGPRLLFLMAFLVSACSKHSPTAPSVTPTPRCATPAPVAAPIHFVESSPAPGSAVTILPQSDASLAPTAPLSMTFEIPADALCVAQLVTADLIADDGWVGASGSVWATPNTGQPTRIVIAHFVLGAQGRVVVGGGDARFTTVTAKVSVGGSQSSLPVAFAFLAPLSQTTTAPTITDLCWDALGAPTGYCREAPLEDELMWYWCTAKDDDGDALTTTLSFHTRSGCDTAAQCWSKTQTFAPRQVPSSVSLYAGNFHFPKGEGQELTCRVVDSHGLVTEKTTCVEWNTPGPCP